MSAYQQISGEPEYAAAVEQSHSQPIVVFKHSQLCELSAMAWQQMQSVRLPIFEVVVQTARPLSNHIEQVLGIRHETPQVIVLYRGRPVFDASHRGVTAAAIHDAADAVRPVS
ncbi:MAG: bacillithiol system redox-active protein YtxJ [Bacteroidota bacterium]|nr:bacillithiol system redox-active protein YtxJ [Bacteroidota bacterium]MDE2834337.1 bacillithiol system redox-active protein YtxJ [Bacteroidota bacterium]